MDYQVVLSSVASALTFDYDAPVPCVTLNFQRVIVPLTHSRAGYGEMRVSHRRTSRRRLV